jgi:hypothetical protein
VHQFPRQKVFLFRTGGAHTPDFLVCFFLCDFLSARHSRDKMRGANFLARPQTELNLTDEKSVGSLRGRQTPTQVWARDARSGHPTRRGWTGKIPSAANRMQARTAACNSKSAWRAQQGWILLNRKFGQAISS